MNNDYPRVTQVLQEAGLIDYSKAPADILEFAKTRGQAVHIACALYDEENLNMNTVDPRILPYLEAWKKYLADSGCEILEIEQPVISEKYKYRGTPDRIVKDKKGLIVLDIKTTAVMYPATAIQLAAYQQAWNESKTAIVMRRQVVLLQDTGACQIKEYKDNGDFNVFLSALNIVSWKRRNKI